MVYCTVCEKNVLGVFLFAFQCLLHMFFFFFLNNRQFFHYGFMFSEKSLKKIGSYRKLVTAACLF